MTTEDFIIGLFCQIDDRMKSVPKHSQANLYPSEIVTLAVLFAIKGVGDRAFYRWIVHDWRSLFPKLPERTRLFRLFKTHPEWTSYFLAETTVLGVADSYGIELLHPYRQGRSPFYHIYAEMVSSFQVWATNSPNTMPDLWTAWIRGKVLPQSKGIWFQINHDSSLHYHPSLLSILWYSNKA